MRTAEVEARSTGEEGGKVMATLQIPGLAMAFDRLTCVLTATVVNLDALNRAISKQFPKRVLRRLRRIDRRARRKAAKNG